MNKHVRLDGGIVSDELLVSQHLSLKYQSESIPLYLRLGRDTHRALILFCYLSGYFLLQFCNAQLTRPQPQKTKKYFHVIKIKWKKMEKNQHAEGRTYRW
jgi:hypothetical protein